MPRHRISGLPFGAARSLRRGRGDDVASARPYVRGDPISTIDWHASARLSTARHDDSFVVRERYADEAPRVVVLCDRRPSMALYPPPFPWLAKPRAVRAAVGAIVASAAAARAAVGYVDHAEEAPFWVPPRGGAEREWIRARQRPPARFAAPEDALERGLAFLADQRHELGSGSFVFVVSDFVAPPPPDAWLEVARRRWDVVPVVVQDPVWEQSFPLVSGVTVPVADPRDGRVLDVRLSRLEARARREANERARADLLAGFAAHDLDPVLLDADGPAAVARAFLGWAERRRALRRRA